MDILNSTWLISMLQKSGKSSRQRLLGLFDVLADWVNAPHIRETLSLDQQEPSTASNLINFLSEQAKTSGAKLPEALAQQLYFIALSALREELRAPGNACISHAKQAAQALIDAQTQREPIANKPLLYGVAASFFVAVGAGSMLLFSIPGQFKPANNIKPAHAQVLLAKDVPNPAHTAEMYATVEQMRKGTCQFPEALMIPESQQAVYLNNVVAGQVSDKAEDQALASKLMQKVRCNYTPMLMANSTS